MKDKSIKRNILCALAMATAAFALNAQTVLLDEDFESGSLASWPAAAGTTAQIDNTRNVVPGGGTRSVNLATSTDIIHRTVSTNKDATSRITGYLYDNGNGGARGFIQPRVYSGGSYGAGGLTTLNGAGKLNNVSPALTGEVFESTRYQGRIGALGFGYDAAGYFNLNGTDVPTRSTGWHRFDIDRGPNPIEGTIIYNYYVDGVLSRSFTNTAAAWTNHVWNTVALGFGAGTTAQEVLYDGIKLVTGQPFIYLNPATQTITVGDPVTLTVGAAGDNLTYQWKKNGVNIPGETTSSYSIGATVETDSGNYTVEVSNSAATLTSLVGVLTVNPAILITQHPQSQSVSTGDNVSFNVVASGLDVLFYQWYFGTNLLAGETSDTLFLSNVQTNQTGNYYVIVSDSLGNPPQTSSNALLIVNIPPTWGGSTNLTATLNQKFIYRPTISDDISVHALPFMDFEDYTNGASVMFRSPNASGTTSVNLDTTATTYTRVTNNYPDGNVSSEFALKAEWTFNSTGYPWLRFTTANGGGLLNPNSIVSFVRPLRFDIYSNRDLDVALGVRETNPTGEIGANGGTTGSSIELIGVDSSGFSAPDPTITILPNTWTTLTFDPVDLALQGKIGSGSGGNNVLNSTTGKGTLDMLCLFDPYFSSLPFEIYVDNFIVVPTNALTFALVSGPPGAVMDSLTGDLNWTPTANGTYPFVVQATDTFGLSSTFEFNVVVSEASTPTSIIYTRLPNGDIQLSWTGTWFLKAATAVEGPYDTVSGASSPHTLTPSQAAQFFRLSNQ